MPNLIGGITTTPGTVAPGQSVLVQVNGPDGTPYGRSEGPTVRVKGVIGAEQYLQFATPGPAKILVSVASGGSLKRERRRCRLPTAVPRHCRSTARVCASWR